MLGYFALSNLSTGTPVLLFLLLFLPIGIGMGVFQSPNNSAIMGSAPSHRLGIVSGMLAFTRTVGQTTGIALLGALWASRVFSYTGRALGGGATDADPAAQAKALGDTFIIVTIIIGLALILALWAFIKYHRSVREEQNGITQPVKSTSRQ